MLGARGTEVQPLPLGADRRGEVGEQSSLVECRTALPHGAGKGGHWNRMGQQCGLAAPMVQVTLSPLLAMLSLPSREGREP